MQAFADGEVQFDIISDGEVVCTKTANGKNPTAEAVIEDVRLWNGTIDPYLYTLKASLVVDGVAVDEVSTKIRCPFIQD